MKLARDEINEAAADWPFDPIVTPMHTSIGTLQFGAQVVNFRMPARFGWCPTTKASDTSRSSGALVANVNSFKLSPADTYLISGTSCLCCLAPGGSRESP